MTMPKETPSIVLLGAWNPAILQPNWLVQRVFNKPDDEEWPVEMEFSPMPGNPPRFRIRDITFIPAYDRLTVFAKGWEDDDLTAAEDAAVRVLELLPHTPVRAAGQNFKFMVASQQEALSMFNVDARLAQYLDFDYNLITTELRSRLQLEDRQLNLFRVRADDAVLVQFNFHYPVADASEAAEKLRHSFIANRDLAKQILVNMNLTVEKE
jgi:hypothetical protein